MLQPLSDVRPDDVTGDIIFYGFSNRSRIGVDLIEEELIKLVLQLGMHGVFPNTNWLTHLISKSCRRVKFNQACNLLNELPRLQAPLETPPFNARLTGLGRCRDVNGKNLNAKRQSNTPLMLPFTITRSMVYAVRRMDDADSVLLKFKLGGFCPDIVCYDALLNEDSNRMKTI
ncbi:hypothetical protein F3Y22_tig00015910pilonHSYRG00016 [Hibiscus syriacus]|uniref:Uncharacterized protein n=1 Tax=Hibiscus syriacus TaxID=106335 RepID=A0A6A3C2P5_HIBSY|nr:hypothetical protein F3Y22_tig00015910pilonHSYRG00016 [Hibiscus syriacus]